MKTENAQRNPTPTGSTLKLAPRLGNTNLRKVEKREIGNGGGETCERKKNKIRKTKKRGKGNPDQEGEKTH